MKVKPHKKTERRAMLADMPTDSRCPNCGHQFKRGEGGHFMPPSLGEKGRFTCRTVLSPALASGSAVQRRTLAEGLPGSF